MLHNIQHVNASHAHMQDLADLADLSLDPALVDDPVSIAGGSADPFASLASEPKQDAGMPYATYGQLVTPQAPAATAAVGSTAIGATTAATGSLLDTSGHAAAAAAAPAAPPQAAGAVTDPFAGFNSSSVVTQPDMQQQQQHPHQQQQQQHPGMQDLLSAEASTPRLLSPEPVVNRTDLPLFITVSEPIKKEATGMLGMKGTLTHTSNSHTHIKGEREVDMKRFCSQPSPI